MRKLLFSYTLYVFAVCAAGLLMGFWHGNSAAPPATNCIAYDVAPHSCILIDTGSKLLVQ